MTDDDAPSISYALRVSERARRDIEAALVRYAENEGAFIATEWGNGINARIATLAENPAGYRIIPENVFRVPVRQVLYKRSPRGAAYRILYTVRDDSPDGPQVLVMHVRHASADALTVKAAREIEAQANLGTTNNGN